VKGAVKDGLGKSLSAREEAGWDENSIQGGKRSCKRFGEIKYFACVETLEATGETQDRSIPGADQDVSLEINFQNV
jgi:hypothetical protein